MKARDLMTRIVASCHPDTPLSDVAQMMIERDCGFIPVRDARTDKVCGVVTDRDAFLAGFRMDKPISKVPAKDAMSKTIHTCIEDEDSTQVLKSMARHQVRRMPVLDSHGVPVGVISLNDLALKAMDDGSQGMKQEVADTLGAICRPRVHA